MTHEEQIACAEAFRRLHRPGEPFLLPNAWDALGARVFEEAGFPAVATSSAAVAWSLGYPDGEALPREALIEAVARMARAVRVPVSADLEAGYGDSPARVADTVTRTIRAGAVGINLEDGVHTPDGGFALRDAGEMAERLAAARAAADATGVPVFINARTDLFLHGAGPLDARLDETLARARLYREAGADGLFPIGLADPARLERLCAQSGLPVNVAPRPGLPALAELAALGVARVSTAAGPALVSLHALTSAARALRESGDLAALSTPLAYPDAQALFAPR